MNLWSNDIAVQQRLGNANQTDYINLGLDVESHYGDRKNCKTTPMYLAEFKHQKRFRDGLSDNGLHDFAEGVVCVMVDEVHPAKADVLKKLLTGPSLPTKPSWG